MDPLYRRPPSPDDLVAARILAACLKKPVRKLGAREWEERRRTGEWVRRLNEGKR